MILSQHVWKIQDREEAIPVAAKAQLIGLVLNRAKSQGGGKNHWVCTGKIEVSHDDLPSHKNGRCETNALIGLPPTCDGQTVRILIL